jgi:hypothetical protein
MKEFSVTLPRQAGATWDHQIVTADYFKIENGALIFRNSRFRNGDNEGYPECVHVFAAGEWTQVRPRYNNVGAPTYDN